MSEDEGDHSEKDQNPKKESEEEALGRSYIADTPEEDPRFEATGVNTEKSEKDGSDGSEDSNDESGE